MANYGRRYGKPVSEEKFNKIVEKQKRHAVRLEVKRLSKESKNETTPSN